MRDLYETDDENFILLTNEIVTRVVEVREQISRELKRRQGKR